MASQKSLGALKKVYNTRGRAKAQIEGHLETIKMRLHVKKTNILVIKMAKKQRKNPKLQPEVDEVFSLE